MRVADSVRTKKRRLPPPSQDQLIEGTDRLFLTQCFRRLGLEEDPDGPGRHSDIMDALRHRKNREYEFSV